MKSQPLQRSAPAMLLGMALLMTGCAPDAGPQPSTSSSPPSATAASPSTTDAASPEPSATPTPDAGTGGEPDGDCPTPPGGAPAGTLDDPYAVGDEIVVGCFTVVVTEVDLDATPELQATHPDDQPSAGNVFTVVKVMIGRTAGEPADVTAIDIRFAADPPATIAADPDLRLQEQSPPMGTLAAGQASGGTLVFDAPTGASPAVLLRTDDGAEIWVAP